MSEKNITFEDLPKAMSWMMDKLNELDSKIDSLNNPSPNVPTEQWMNLKELCDYFIERLSDISFIKLNRGAGEYCDHIINISFDGYIGENVLHFLEMCGILVSVGSACSSRSKSRGRVLKAQGFDFSSAVRISFCPQNTKAEIDEFFKAALRVKDELIKAR